MYAGGFDARLLTPGEAGEVVRVCAQIEASAASIKALAAARAAEGKDWQQQGYRSAADQMAHETGMSPSAARRTLDTGRRLSEQPEVASAALAGELSLEQATAVSDGVAADPRSARELIEKAKHASLPELNEVVAKVKAANTDLEERRRARHAKRSLRRWTDRDGACHVHLYGHPEDGARLWPMLDPIRRRLNSLRRQAGLPNDTLEALDYDALMTMADVSTGSNKELTLSDLIELGLFPQCDHPREPTPTAEPDDHLALSVEPSTDPSSTKPGVARVKRLAGSPLRVMVRVDLDALLRGVPIEGELCEISGYGPVPVSVVEDLLATENPFIIGVLTKAETVVGVYHHGRHPNAHQRSALDFLYPTCAVEGCSSTAGLQYDHRVDYAKAKITAFDLLDRLCGHHHRLKTNQGWALVNGKGKRRFVPPEDPRHPHGTRCPDRGGPTPAGPVDDPPPNYAQRFVEEETL
jgi:hypothetical protein